MQLHLEMSVLKVLVLSASWQMVIWHCIKGISDSTGMRQTDHWFSHLPSGKSHLPLPHQAEKGSGMVRFENTACSDSHLGFGTCFPPVSPEPWAEEHRNIPGREFLLEPHCELWPWAGAGGTAAQQRHTAACEVTARVHWYTSAWQLL